LTENSTGNGNRHKKSFPGKIAVITSDISTCADDFHSPKSLLAKYGPDKIMHATWPASFVDKQECVIDTVASLAADKELKALILNQALPGSNAAVDKFRELRDDVFIVYCTVHEEPAKAASRAHLILMNNELGMGYELVNQARKQGAKVLVHYSFPRHMSIGIYSSRRDLIRQECLKKGIEYVDAIALDPTEEAGTVIAQRFIQEDVPRMVARYGEDTAFFCTNCALQAPLIRAIVDCHAIYPQPCCPSPYHGFPEALGMKTADGMNDLNYVISEACRIAGEKNMSDRLSTWPVSASMMFTNAGAEYAIKWIRDEVPKTGISDKVLANCMGEYIREVVGEESNVFISSYAENSASYENFKLILMSYLDF